MSYIVKSNIVHNKVSYAKGDVISDITKDQATLLIKDGVLESSDTPSAPAPEKTTEPSDTTDTTSENPGFLGKIFGSKDTEPSAPAPDLSVGL